MVQRADIRDELPDLIFGNLSAPGGHSIGAPLHNRVEDIFRRRAVSPLVLHQRRPDSASTIRVAAGAVIPTEQALPFRDREGIILIGIGYACRRLRSAGNESTLPRGVGEDGESSR